MCEGLGIVPSTLVNLLLHHEDHLPGVEGVVEDGGDVDVEASPGRLDFLTVGEKIGDPNRPRVPSPPWPAWSAKARR